MTYDNCIEAPVGIKHVPGDEGQDVKGIFEDTPAMVEIYGPRHSKRRVRSPKGIITYWYGPGILQYIIHKLK